MLKYTLHPINIDTNCKYTCQIHFCTGFKAQKNIDSAIMYRNVYMYMRCASHTGCAHDKYDALDLEVPARTWLTYKLRLVYLNNGIQTRPQGCMTLELHHQYLQIRIRFNNYLP